jgi:hypothetical protein
MRLRVVASVLVAATVLGASAAAGSGLLAEAPVGLTLPAGRALYPGENVPVTVVDNSAGAIYHSYCFVLARLDASGWRQVAFSHGVKVACSISVGEIQASRSRQPLDLVLYDDLHPGAYRITLYYRPAPRHWGVLKALTRRDRAARLRFTIGSAPPQPKPRLSEERLLHLAISAARHDGDPRLRLIQYASGTHFEAVLVGQGDLVFEWNWSYLIAVRGHFSDSNVGPAGSSSTVRGKVITLVVDAATGQVTDYGLSNRYPALRRLGRVTTDLRG